MDQEALFSPSWTSSNGLFQEALQLFLKDSPEATASASAQGEVHIVSPSSCPKNHLLVRASEDAWAWRETHSLLSSPSHRPTAAAAALIADGEEDVELFPCAPPLQLLNPFTVSYAMELLRGDALVPFNAVCVVLHWQLGIDLKELRKLSEELLSQEENTTNTYLMTEYQKYVALLQSLQKRSHQDLFVEKRKDIAQLMTTVDRRLKPENWEEFMTCQVRNAIHSGATPLHTGKCTSEPMQTRELFFGEDVSSHDRPLILLPTLTPLPLAPKHSVIFFLEPDVVKNNNMQMTPGGMWWLKDFTEIGKNKTLPPFENILS